MVKVKISIFFVLILIGGTAFLTLGPVDSPFEQESDDSQPEDRTDYNESNEEEEEGDTSESVDEHNESSEEVPEEDDPPEDPEFHDLPDEIKDGEQIEISYDMGHYDKLQLMISNDNGILETNKEVSGESIIEHPDSGGDWTVTLSHDNTVVAEHEFTVHEEEIDPVNGIDIRDKNVYKHYGFFPGDTIGVGFDVIPHIEDGEIAEYDIYVEGEHYDSNTIGENPRRDSVTGVEVTKDMEPTAEIRVEMGDYNDTIEIPVLVDRSGDGLYTYWEENEGVELESGEFVEFPDAHPDKLDMYLDVVYHEDANKLTDNQIGTLQDWYANLPTESDENKTGVNLHYVGNDRTTDKSYVVDSIAGDGEGNYDDFLDEYHMSHELYHTVVVTDLENYETRDGHVMIGQVRINDGNAISMVEKELGKGVFSSQPIEETVMKETLHNTVGYITDEEQRECDQGPGYSCTGFLSQYDWDDYLPEVIGEDINVTPHRGDDHWNK